MQVHAKTIDDYMNAAGEREPILRDLDKRVSNGEKLFGL